MIMDDIEMISYWYHFDTILIEILITIIVVKCVLYWLSAVFVEFVDRIVFYINL